MNVGEGISTGIDIIRISRIEGAAKNAHFLSRVFTKGEVEYSFSKRSPYLHLALRFAAKEACYKAFFTTGLSSVMDWRDIEVVDAGGAPSIVLHRSADRFAAGRGVHLSLSHSSDVAAAFVVIG